MNYYEELGLTPSASAEEIRQASNEVVAVLSDPAERGRYDLSLAIHRRGARDGQAPGAEKDSGRQSRLKPAEACPW